MPLEARENCTRAAPFPDGPSQPLRLQLPATSIAVRHTLYDLRRHWRTNGINDTLSATAEQVLAEVLNNIVEHAMTDLPDGVIQVSLCAGKNQLICNVRDNGIPLPGGAMPSGELNPLGPELENTPEGGFGWFLIRSLTTDLTYRRAEGWNDLNFRISPPSPYEMR